MKVSLRFNTIVKIMHVYNPNLTKWFSSWLENVWLEPPRAVVPIYRYKKNGAADQSKDLAHSTNLKMRRLSR